MGDVTYGSLFSGVGGFDIGFDRAGMICKWQVEQDKNCLEVLHRHWPDVPKFTDVCAVGKENLEPVDVICGGFPCVDVSVAGRRTGLAGAGSGLWFEFRRVLEEIRPGTCIIENVPGLLSSKGGRDFAVILRGLGDIGYRVAWRILDARYFRVAQRRRRVFIVGNIDSGRASQILFESEGVSRHTQTRKAARQVAPILFASDAGTSRTASAGSESEFCIPVVAGTQGSRTVRANCGGALPMVSAPILAREGKGPIGDMSRDNIVAFTQEETPKFGNLSGTLDAQEGRRNSVAIPAVGVRRLTPMECARLQGFPDDWNSELADRPRYKQFGNAVCVNVAEWIGRRLMDAITARG